MTIKRERGFDAKTGSCFLEANTGNCCFFIQACFFLAFFFLRINSFLSFFAKKKFFL